MQESTLSAQSGSVTPLQSSVALRPVIVSDLDGTLLDHFTYDFEPARGLLQQLRQAQIPVVLCTSKTRAEVVPLRSALENRAPFIVENGAAVYLPCTEFPEPLPGCERRGDYWCKAFCEGRAHWLALLEESRAYFVHRFHNFDAMSDRQLAELTGLSPSQAAAARQREFGEPLQWLGSAGELEEFQSWFAERGARVLSGGRFVHVCGDSDKGRAMNWLLEVYRQKSGRPRLSIALGDSDNDLAMLETADRAVLVRSPAHAPPVLQRSRGYWVSEAVGPAGWVQGVTYWLNELGIPLPGAH